MCFALLLVSNVHLSPFLLAAGAEVVVAVLWVSGRHQRSVDEAVFRAMNESAGVRTEGSTVCTNQRVE